MKVPPMGYGKDQGAYATSVMRERNDALTVDVSVSE